jgi:hypothetical protein
MGISPWDVRIKLGEVVGQGADGRPQAKHLATILMAPGHAKAVLEALQRTIHTYEEKFGEIDLAKRYEQGIFLLLRSFLHNPGSGLAGVLFAIVAFESGSELLQGISNIRQAGNETCATKCTNTGCRGTRDLVVDSQASNCHADSLPQVLS